jgi:hypothetical protein
VSGSSGSLCSERYNLDNTSRSASTGARAAAAAQEPTVERQLDHWQARLPASLHPHVVIPVRVEMHSDDSVPATKWRGYDALGLLCWYRHHYAQWDAAFDDDDQPGLRLLREEELEAWRGLAGAWVRRVQRLHGDGRPYGGRSDSGFEVVEPGEIPRL